MKAFKNLAVLVLAAVALGAGVLAFIQYQQLIKLHAQLLGPDGKGLERSLADAQKRIRSLQDELAALRARPAAAAAAADEQGADNQPGGRGRRGRFAGGPGAGRFAALANNPEFQKLQSIQLKAQLDQRYAALFKTLNLSPEQLDQFKTLLVQRQQAQQDAMQAAFQQGLNPRQDRQAFEQAIADAQTSVDQQIQSLLGDSGYPQYQQYQQTMPERNTVSQVQQALSYSGAPLSDDQANQLVALLAQNQPSNQNGGGGRGFGGGGFGGPGGAFGGGGPPAQITPQVLTLAQSVLSGPQLQALQQVQQQQQAQQQMRQLMQTNRQNGGGARGGNGNGG
ncbi:MAG TPA: hypothetical protein VHC86_15640 [Opitutaceae bacterium]|nr:hypothetical protein [Opitutaceae bacterium]